MTGPTRDRFDLHTHSTASDGLLPPAELVAQAAALGITVLALTDHDTIVGLSDALEAATALDIDLIPGVELSAEADGLDAHVLGYFVDPSDGDLAAELQTLAAQRLVRTERIAERLTKIGLPIDFARVQELAAGGTVGRPHVARVMIESGYVQTVSEAFDRYLSAGRPGFVPRSKTLPEDSVRLIRRAGAVPVLAHPYAGGGDVEAMIARLIPAGLLGIEVYYAEYSAAQHRALREIADRWTLIPTGGSDYHGPHFKEGRELGNAPVPRESVDRLRLSWEALREERPSAH
jgi:predicted metal-dependent phosphoesterase TrpH